MKNLERLLLTGWSKNSREQLVKKFEFVDFRQAFSFVKKVASLAETQNHHPDIIIKYNIVTIKCKSHDVDSITQRDIELASGITKIHQHFL